MGDFEIEKSRFQIEGPGGHLDQLIRQTRAHHVQLSTMADLKASVLLTTAALIVPLTLHFVDHPQLGVAAMVLIGFSLLTVLLAGYATMPKFRRPPGDPDSPGFDLLFFGSFTQLGEDGFLRRMQDVLNDPSRVYEVQLKEVYALGAYLCRAKYRWIRLAYGSFITGLVSAAAAGVVGYAVAFFS